MSNRRINARQCREARALLHWNLIDVLQQATHTTLARLKDFEEGLIHLMQGEMDEIIRIYEHEDILFLDNGNVILKQPDEKAGGAFAMHVAPKAPAAEAPPPPPKAPPKKTPQTVTKMIGNTIVTQTIAKKKPPY